MEHEQGPTRPAARSISLEVSADPMPQIALSSRLLGWAGLCRPGIHHVLLHVTTDGHEWLIGLLGLAHSRRQGVIVARIGTQRETIIWRSHMFAPQRSALLLRCPGERDHDHWVKVLIAETRPPWRCLRCTAKETGWRYSTFDVLSPLRWRENRDIMIGHPLLQISRGGIVSAQVGALIEHRDEMLRRSLRVR